jgi:membrane-bound lytic murein transglycosylase D
LILLALSLSARFCSLRFLALLVGMQLFMPQVDNGVAKSSGLNHSLPQYAGISSDIEFWERIYSVNDSSQCLLVDEDNLSRVFEVVDLPRRRWSKKKKIARSIAKLKRSLRSIAKDPQRELNVFDQQTKLSVSTNTLDPEQYKSIAKRLRCQRGMRGSLQMSFELAKAHLPTVFREVKELGLPADLAYLPYLESGYRRKARSPVGARGLWQLMPETARSAGLKVNRRVDQRLDVQRSTRAALLELKKYHETTKSWGLALTSYVYGHNGVMREVNDHKSNSYVYIRANHKSKIFQFSSKNYYPRLLAIRNVMHRLDLPAKELSQQIKSRDPANPVEG